MQKTNKRIKNLKFNKKVVILVIATLLLASCIIPFGIQTIQRVAHKEDSLSFGYEIINYLDDDVYEILITAESAEGIEYIQYPDGDILEIKDRTIVAIDYRIIDDVEYKFKIKEKEKEEKERIIYKETAKVKGQYQFVNGVWLNIPDLTGFVKENTRYVYSDDKGNLVPGNWLIDTEPQNWYSYKEQKWANIYVETNGVDSYYIWIPRYAYKIDEENSVTGNERMDVKFIDTSNNYKDENGNLTTWLELKEQGYQIPEAFAWGDDKSNIIQIPGYWMSKYQLSELDEYILDYSLATSKTQFNVSNFTNNMTTTVNKYTYAINGQIVHESGTLEDYSFINGTPDENNYINITALDANGSIIASMTKKNEFTEVNPPDLTGFDKDTTFYVYWDENGQEHNEIPISQEPPENWYNYTYSEWANIVTRNDGLESYYVWIPRYQYALDQTSQRSDVKFILGTGTETDTSYKIPEAFTWGDDGEIQLTGYWMSKYQLSTEETTPKITAGITAGSSVIRVGEITGTILTTTDEEGNTVSVPLKYEYYLDGNKVHEGTSSTEGYAYTGLKANTAYTVNIIARNATTNAYVGAITQKIKTIGAYAPDLTGFDEETTFYVIYNEDGTEKQRISIKNDVPDDWYDYSDRRWANIVTTANETESYFVWIPRYEYRILEDRENESLANKRTEVNFITTDTTNENCTTGYKVPEAFTWGDNGEIQIPGYWMSKYQLSQ